MVIIVISGKGEGIVLVVGKDILYGGFIKLDFDDKNFFKKGVDFIVWVMICFMVILVFIVFILLGIIDGKWMEFFVFVLLVVVGLMLEMFFMVIIVCFVKGSFVMSKKQIIIKDINVMQSFGSMDVFCMDKIGIFINESILLEYYMDIFGNENVEVFDFVYLNSCYYFGVCNIIDNVIFVCNIMLGWEVYYVNFLIKF